MRDIGDAMAAAGNEVAWTATTGRAARVLHEGGTTLHAFLGIRPGSPKHRNEQRVDLLVVDETSMLDTWLAGPLGSYMTDGLAERVVLIGDPYQLPPVGAGKVLSELRDLAGGCLSSSQVVELTTMRRTDATGILAVAKAIRARQPLPDFNDTPGVSVYPANKLALSKVVDLAGGHPDDALVIAPRKDGPLGVRSLNAALRDAHLGLSDEMWIEGMRVVQNKTKKIEERDNLIVPNGTFGVITRITTEAITVTYEDGVEVDWQHKQCAYDDGMIAPAYALTIHKAQGSQASHVVVVADPGIPEAWKDPAMGYTAVTRAIHDLVVIGDPEVLRGNPDTGVEERLTMLVPRMLHRLAKPQQAKGS
ncbi:MAG: ATP-dependent RecD-like DNA helicase [Actinobacteria bacterium]|nr:ATP-dependent RecD-like DNA helicase [Actinomycetota bacterium]